MRLRSSLVLLVSLVFAGAALARAQAPTGGDTTFRLEPGDVVQTQIWREKDLNGKWSVDERGRLTLPMIGTFVVSGIPWTQLRDSLITLYQAQLRNPSIILIPLRRVQVLGEVTKPGNYYADPTLSLAGLVALAGGATPLGDLHHVRVVRNGKTIVESASVESLLLDAGVRSNDQIFVDRRDWLERNGAFVASALISTAGILVALIRR